jgi:hypothetical protein
MSNETKWTPGPWIAVDHDRYPGMITVKGPSSPITIVTSATNIDFAGHCRRVCEGHLIASAPELYEALRVSVEALEKTANDTLIGRNAAEVGRTVLAKARGA